MLLFSCSVVSDFCDPHGMQHTRLPHPPQSSRVCQNSCPLDSDVNQPPHPRLPTSPPALNLSQHQGLFQSVGSSHQVAKYWSFSISPSNEYPGFISFRIDSLTLGLISLLSERLSRLFSSATVPKHQVFSAQPSLWSNSHTHT